MHENNTVTAIHIAKSMSAICVCAYIQEGWCQSDVPPIPPFELKECPAIAALYRTRTEVVMRWLGFLQVAELWR